jgi:GNAT superfamily N-acetyltransferase
MDDFSDEENKAMMGIFTNDIIKILKLAAEYNFYKMEILLYITTKKAKYLLRDWGFLIYRIFEDAFIIEFVFVKPEYRRMGILTKHINVFKKVKAVIGFTTSNNEMCSFGNKEGFKVIKKTRCGKELFWAWSEKYSKNDIINKYY